MKACLMLFLLFISGSVHSQTPANELPDLSIERLLAVPLSITVDGKKLFLDGSMSIDFMPSIPPGPRTVRTHCFLSTVDKSELPPSIKADAIWIVYKNEVNSIGPYKLKPTRLDTTTKIWKSPLTEDTGYNYKYKKLYRASEGNFLGVGGNADLIVRVKDSKGNKWFVRTRAVVIRVE